MVTHTRGARSRLLNRDDFAAVVKITGPEYSSGFWVEIAALRFDDMQGEIEHAFLDAVSQVA
jgi:hypothetical protein